MQASWWWSKNETCRSDIYVYFNVNFNVFFKLIKVYLFVSELYTKDTAFWFFVHIVHLIEETEWCYEISFLIFSLRTVTPAAKRCADVAEDCCVHFEYPCPAFQSVWVNLDILNWILLFQSLKYYTFHTFKRRPYSTRREGMFLNSNYNAVRQYFHMNAHRQEMCSSYITKCVSQSD